MNDRGVLYPLSGDISVLPVKGRGCVFLSRQNGIDLTLYTLVGISLGVNKTEEVSFYVLCELAGTSPRGNAVVSLTAIRVILNHAQLVNAPLKRKVILLSNQFSKKRYRIDRVIRSQQ